MKIILALHSTTFPRNIICVSLFSFSASQIFQLPFESQNGHVDEVESIPSMFLARRIWKKNRMYCKLPKKNPLFSQLLLIFIIFQFFVCVSNCVCVCEHMYFLLSAYGSQRTTCSNQFSPWKEFQGIEHSLLDYVTSSFTHWIVSCPQPQPSEKFPAIPLQDTNQCSVVEPKIQRCFFFISLQFKFQVL